MCSSGRPSPRKGQTNTLRTAVTWSIAVAKVRQRNGASCAVSSPDPGGGGACVHQQKGATTRLFPQATVLWEFRELCFYYCVESIVPASGPEDVIGVGWLSVVTIPRFGFEGLGAPSSAISEVKYPE